MIDPTGLGASSISVRLTVWDKEDISCRSKLNGGDRGEIMNSFPSSTDSIGAVFFSTGCKVERTWLALLLMIKSSHSDSNFRIRSSYGKSPKRHVSSHFNDNCINNILIDPDEMCLFSISK